jgi:hypothetical protein
MYGVFGLTPEFLQNMSTGRYGGLNPPAAGILAAEESEFLHDSGAASPPASIPAASALSSSNSAAPYVPPYSSNVFRPPGVPTASHFIAPSRPVVPAFPSASGAASSAASTPAASALSSSKAAEVLAQQQAAEDKKRGYPTIKGKPVAQCKRKSCGTEELKVPAVMACLPLNRSCFF